MTIHDFITARLAEDERALRLLDEHLDGHERPHNPADPTEPTRVLRHIAAGRAILGIHKRIDPTYASSYERYACQGCHATFQEERWCDHIDECRTLRAFALTWSDHPDYQPEWAEIDE